MLNIIIILFKHTKIKKKNVFVLVYELFLNVACK